MTNPQKQRRQVPSPVQIFELLKFKKPNFDATDRRLQSALTGTLGDAVDVVPLAGALSLAEQDVALAPSTPGRWPPRELLAGDHGWRRPQRACAGSATPLPPGRAADGRCRFS